jgi:LytS/YehU family sensor histidine kinase
MWKMRFSSFIFHLILSISIAAAHQFISLSLYIGITWLTQGYLLDLFGVHSVSWIIKGTIPSFIQYWLIIALLWGYQYYQLKRIQELKLIRKDREIADAQFNALKMQLHPHFFFNTLNTISSVMDRNVEDAQNIVAKLAFLMRSLVDSDKKQFTRLEDEIQYIRDYLHLEQARFEGSLNVSFEINDDVLKSELPNLLLQPLVENSIKHGLAALTKDKLIKISACAKNNSLYLCIKDNGIGVANVDYIIQNPGIGLKSVMDRIEHLYGNKAKLSIISDTNEGFEVNIMMPLRHLED